MDNWSVPASYSGVFQLVKGLPPWTTRQPQRPGVVSFNLLKVPKNAKLPLPTPLLSTSLCGLRMRYTSISLPLILSVFL